MNRLMQLAPVVFLSMTILSGSGSAWAADAAAQDMLKKGGQIMMDSAKLLSQTETKPADEMKSAVMKQGDKLLRYGEKMKAKGKELKNDKMEKQADVMIEKGKIMKEGKMDHDEMVKEAGDLMDEGQKMVETGTGVR